jgi:hypothetical protein
MLDAKINSVSFSFIGLFPYEKTFSQIATSQKEFSPSDFYDMNKKYVDQKYYANWIHSFFKKSTGNNEHRHFKLKKSSPLFEKELQLEVDDKKKSIGLNVREVNVFFFEANLGMFVIKIDLLESHFNWQDIVAFGSTFRQSTINKKYQETSLSVDLIEEYITPKFHSDAQAWRKYNPLLKSAVFIDIDKQPDKESMDKLLYQIGTYSMSFGNNDIFEPDTKYLQNLINENGISIFKNWKALCLYDSICRIAVNLNKKDKYKLWENEYILIYIYVLYARYFLHYTNNQLTILFENSKLVERERDNFFKFKNEFNHTKISYKFLPNVIYKKLKKTLDIDEEVNLIEEKLTRVNILNQEKYQSRINRILFLLTLLTLISVAYDGGQLLGSWKWSQSLIISLIIGFISVITIIIIFYFTKSKK